MEIGIDSFAKKTQTNEGGTVQDDARAMSELIERIVHADKVGLDVFGLGEHHREEFLDSAAHNILSAAAAKTENIRLTSAVAVCLLYTSPSPRDRSLSRMPSSA